MPGLVAFQLLVLLSTLSVAALGQARSSTVPLGTTARHLIFSADAGDTVASIVSTIGTSPVTAEVFGTISYGASTTAPTNITWDLHSGQINCGGVSGAITLQGPLLTGPGQPIFTSCPSGSVRFTGNTSIGDLYPQWWGAMEDGVTDDGAAVQAAVTAAPAHGRVLITGTTAIGAGGIAFATRTNVSLVGIGPGAGILALAQATTNLGTFGKTFIRNEAGTGISVKNLYLDGGGFAHNILGLHNSTDCEVSNNYLVRAGNLNFVWSTGGVRNRFTDNRIVGTYVSGVRGLWIGNTNSTEAEHEVVIRGNQVLNVGATALNVVVQDGVVTDNVLANDLLADGAGIAITSFGVAQTQKLVITGNTIKNHNYQGIQADVSVASTTYGTDVTIMGNTIEGSGTCGVYVVHAQRWVVTGNVIRDSLYCGIFLAGATEISITENIVYDSRSGGARTQQYGVIAQPTTPANIVDNTNLILNSNIIYNNKTRGIYLNNGAGTTIKHATIEGNQVFGNGTAGIDITANTAGDIDYLNVTHNEISGNGTDIVLAKTMAHLVMKDNSVYSTTYDTVITAPAKALTDALTSLFDIALASGSRTSGKIDFRIDASDGTEQQSYHGLVTYAVVNKGGVYTATITQDANTDAKAVSSGTLTTSWAIATGTNKVTVQVTPAGSLTETTYQIYFTVSQDTNQAVTLL